MRQKFKTIKRNIVRRFAQAYADFLITRLEAAQKNDDQAAFEIYYEQGAKLNAYCIVFHDIYLD